MLQKRLKTRVKKSKKHCDFVTECMQCGTLVFTADLNESRSGRAGWIPLNNSQRYRVVSAKFGGSFQPDVF